MQRLKANQPNYVNTKANYQDRTLKNGHRKH